MAITYDFQIIARTDVPGISLVLPQNEDVHVYHGRRGHDLSAKRVCALLQPTRSVTSFLMRAGSISPAISSEVTIAP